MERSSATQPRHDQEHSAGELVKVMSEQVSALIRDELKLAQLEMIREGKQAGVGVGLPGGSAPVALYGAGCLIACVIIAVAGVVAAGLAALIVGASMLAVAAAAAPAAIQAPARLSAPCSGRYTAWPHRGLREPEVLPRGPGGTCRAAPRTPPRRRQAWLALPTRPPLIPGDPHGWFPALGPGKPAEFARAEMCRGHGHG